MSKKSTKALASATLMSLVLTTALSAGPVKAAQGPVTRVSGQTRYSTAAEVAKANWKDGSKNVVLVSGEGFADAVSASALAKKLDAPILLTTPDTLSQDAQSALDTLKPDHIYIVGGTGAVSQSIRDNLKSKYTNAALVELGGQNRYETNVAVAKQLVTLGVSPSNVMVVGGEKFADALSVAPIASAKGQILLLANTDQASSQSAINFVKDNKSTATIVGTTNMISDAVKNAFGSSATRIDGGSSRFDTNLKVLNAFKSDLKTDKLYVATASAADPDNLFADALVASALAGKYTAPLVLVDKDGTDATNQAVSFIKSENAQDIEVVGGTAVVPDSIISEITGTPVGPTNPTVNSISSNGLNQIKVVFNQEVDSDTAEDVANYKVDGVQLKDLGTTDATGKATDTPDVNGSGAKAVLQDDNKTVLITLEKARKQGDNIDVTVKKGILSSDKSATIPEFTQSVSFNDTTAPTVQSVEARGNSKLTVEFSEPINFGKVDLSNITSKFKINGQNISSFGLDTTASKIKDYVKDANGNAWSNKVDFYFNSSLTTGNNTLTVSDGDNGILYDAANFPVKETTENFSVDTVTGAPQITGISGEDDGKIYVNFDRPMDAKTAVDPTYYVLNNPTDDSKTLATQYKDGSGNFSGKIELKKNDTQVKISGISLQKGSNTLYIKNNVKDAYGQKVADDTRKSFDLSEDTTKPAVTSVTTLDDTTIRVRFNKDVDVTYATNTTNYKIQDNSGTDITTDIGNSDGKITVPGGSTVSASVFDIHMKNKLSDAKYTITIKHIIDTASTANVMDDYTTTFDGSNDLTPSVVDYNGVDTSNAYAVKDTTDSNPFRKVTIYFNKAMDSSSLTNTANYKFTNGSGDKKALPSGTDITTSSDNKSATIKFPSGYGTNNIDTLVNINGTNSTILAKSGDNLIKQVAVIGAKDQAGNALDVSALLNVVSAPADGTTLVDQKSYRVYYDGDNLKVDVKFTSPIDNLNYKDFVFNNGTNDIVPDSGYKNGSSDKITFQFNDGSTDANGNKIDQVKSAGENIKFKLVGSDTVAANTTDVTGSKVAVAAAGYVTPWYYDAAPKTIADSWNSGIVGRAGVAKDAALKDEASGDGYIDIVFDTPIDDQSGVTLDGFIFTDATTGTNLEANKVVIKGNVVRFTFDQTKYAPTTYFAANHVYKINANPSVTIRTPKDENGDYTKYAPSSDDLKVRHLTFDQMGAKTN